jgi:hypothetical protein
MNYLAKRSVIEVVWHFYFIEKNKLKFKMIFFYFGLILSLWSIEGCFEINKRFNIILYNFYLIFLD